MGEIDSFGRSQHKGCIVIGSLILLLIGAILFFSLGEFRASGIFRSGKSSGATELYQLYPVQQNGAFYFVAVEGVFKTRIYNRQGGMTMRSDSTDVRMSVYDISNGQMLKREVIGDFPDDQLKILGFSGDALWTYDMQNGLQSRSLPELEVKTTQDKIMEVNTDLASGLAKPDQYFGNFDELYAYDAIDNAVMVTTVDGRQLWIDLKDLKTIAAPQHGVKSNLSYSSIDDLVESAIRGEEITPEDINALVRDLSIDITSSHYPDVIANQALASDSCTYTLEGSTIKTLVKTNCPQPAVINTKKDNNSFIEPVFLSALDGETGTYVNPEFLSDKACLILHSAKMGDKTDLQLSLVSLPAQKIQWTLKTGIVMNNYKSSYSINALFGYGDTLLVAINDQLFSISLSKGKINWKTAGDANDYSHNLYYSGMAETNNSRYIIISNSYFTELSRDGFFMSGRTDYRVQVLDVMSGKVLKKMDAKGSASQDLPFYLGISSDKAWFYDEKDGIHSRTLPDLKMEIPFSDIKKATEAELNVVHSGNFGEALNSDYIALDEQHKLIYITTQNGLHYAISTDDLRVREVENPTSAQYDKWQALNTQVDFYGTRIYNYYHHDLQLKNGASIKLEEQNGIGKLVYTENKKDQSQNNTTASPGQFIEGQFLMNAISVEGNTIFTDRNKTPLLLNKNEKALYILHKDKISPEAHSLISKYDIATENVQWKYDVSEHFKTAADIERLYTLRNTIICVFKTHPDLDDNFTAIAIDANSGQEVWNFEF